MNERTNEMLDDTIGYLSNILGSNLIAAKAAGSRVTCNPAPTNTDNDYIVHVEDLAATDDILVSSGWEIGGSPIPLDANHTHQDERFVSLTLGDINLIITASESFYRRFVAATYVAKRFNLLIKADRIALFQAVLYGNTHEPE